MQKQGAMLYFASTAAVELSYIKLGPGNLQKFAIILFSDWAKLLLNTGRFCRQLCGVSTFREMQEVLTEFWDRYKALHSNHDLFKMEDVDLSMTVPVYSHTDEGRS